MEEKINSIIEIVCRYYSHPVSIISSTSNVGTYSKIRQVCQYCLFHFLNKNGDHYANIYIEKAESLGLQLIANMFKNGISHNAIMSNLRTVKGLTETDFMFHREINEICSLIYKNVDFGSKTVIATSQIESTSVELLLNKDGNKMYRVITAGTYKYYTENEMSDIITLAQQLSPNLKKGVVEYKNPLNEKFDKYAELTAKANAEFKRHYRG
jgi:hypothetical protein